MQKRIACLIICSGLLAACSNPFSSKITVECNDEASRQLVVETLTKRLNQTGLAGLQALMTDQGVDIDLVKFKAAVQQIKFELADVLTDRVDPATNKKFCQASLGIAIPSSLLNDANASRAIVQDIDLQKLAILSDLELKGAAVQYALEYSVQPTDDGQKIYTQVQNAEPAVEFINQVLLAALQKPARLTAQHEAAAAATEQQAAQEQARLDSEKAAEDAHLAAEQNARQAARSRLQQQQQLANLNSAPVLGPAANRTATYSSRPVYAAPAERAPVTYSSQSNDASRAVGPAANRPAAYSIPTAYATGHAAGPAAASNRMALAEAAEVATAASVAAVAATDTTTATENSAKFSEKMKQLEKQLSAQ